jgi:hypothetical protein
MAAKRVSRTAPETAPTATILVRLWVAVDIIDAAPAGVGPAFDFLCLGFGAVFAAMEFPKERAGQAAYAA